MHRFTYQLGQQLTHLAWLVILAVEFGGEPQGFLADLVHHTVQGRVTGNRFAGVECVEEVVEVHGSCRVPGYRAPVR